MGAFRSHDDDREPESTYPATRSGVVPALSGNDAVPNLWDESSDEEVTGETARFPSSQRSKVTPHLTIMTGLGAGQVVSFGGRAELVIGRSRNADLRLVDEGISRRHCRLVQRGEVVTVEDLDSMNGTIVNGATVANAELKAGDRIQLGPKLILQLGMFDETEQTLARRLFDGLTRDALTGTLNRRAFDERLAVEVAHAQRHKSALSVMIVDVDELKGFSTTYGQSAADDLLKAIAEAIGQTVRASDVFCRYGGGQFAIVVRDTLDNACRLAERLRMRIARLRLPASRRQVPITVSIGAAEIGERGAQLTAEGLARVAEKRVARASSVGGDRVTAE